MNCYSKNFIDVFSFSENAAAAALLSHPSVGLAVENRFLLPEFKLYTISGVLPTSVGSFGLQLHYFGYALYNETEPALGYAKKLGGIELGVKFNYRVLNIATYGKQGTLIPEIGTVWHISDRVHTGIRIYHPLSSRHKIQMTEAFASSYSTGVGYEISNLVFIGFTVSKEEERPVEYHSAIQYQFSGQFFARFGFSTSSTQARIGAGWKKRALRIDVTASWHARLGISPCLQLIYDPVKPKK